MRKESRLRAALFMHVTVLKDMDGAFIKVDKALLPCRKNALIPIRLAHFILKQLCMIYWYCLAYFV